MNATPLIKTLSQFGKYFTCLVNHLCAGQGVHIEIMWILTLNLAGMSIVIETLITFTL